MTGISNEFLCKQQIFDAGNVLLYYICITDLTLYMESDQYAQYGQCRIEKWRYIYGHQTLKT